MSVRTKNRHKRLHGFGSPDPIVLQPMVSAVDDGHPDEDFPPLDHLDDPEAVLPNDEDFKEAYENIMGNNVLLRCI